MKEEGFESIDIPLADIKVYQPKGCNKCVHGYKGRIGLYEVLKVTPTLAKLIMEGGNSLQMAEQGKKEGYRTLRQSALKKVAEGIISLEEANRVTME